MNKLFVFFSLSILLGSFFLYREIEILDIVELDPVKTGARCLDGSDYQFYIQKGKGDGANNFLLFFDGGGWCSSKVYNSTLESCYKRTETYLGSSNGSVYQKIANYFGIKKIVLFKRFASAFSSDSSYNPTFHNWNKVFMSYCDGRGFLGSNKDPIEYKDKNFYFRGYNNVVGVLDYIKDNFNEKEINNMTIAGVSAGGTATFHYSNFISDYFPNIKGSVKAVSDSGFFLDIENSEKKNYNFGIIWKELITHTKLTLPKNLDFCPYKDKEWKCYLPEYIYPKIKIPMFIIHSQYDLYTACNLIGKCSNMTLFSYYFAQLPEPLQTRINENRIKLSKIFNDIYSSKPKWNIFSPACYVHDFLSYSTFWDRVVYVHEKTVKEAIDEWYHMKATNTERKTIYMDSLEWPNNSGCAYNRDIMYILEYFRLSDIF